MQVQTKKPSLLDNNAILEGSTKDMATAIATTLAEDIDTNFNRYLTANKLYKVLSRVLDNATLKEAVIEQAQKYAQNTIESKSYGVKIEAYEQTSYQYHQDTDPLLVNLLAIKKEIDAAIKDRYKLHQKIGTGNKKKVIIEQLPELSWLPSGEEVELWGAVKKAPLNVRKTIK